MPHEYCPAKRGSSENTVSPSGMSRVAYRPKFIWVSIRWSSKLWHRTYRFLCLPFSSLPQALPSAICTNWHLSLHQLFYLSGQASDLFQFLQVFQLSILKDVNKFEKTIPSLALARVTSRSDRDRDRDKKFIQNNSFSERASFVI